MAFQKAKREKLKARICLTGASGGGKTLSALYLAYGITQDWDKIAVLDTERKRALAYVDRTDLPFETGEFIHEDFEPPFTIDRYVEKMREAEEIVGEDGVLIIDSGSHAWKGNGGVLDAKESIANQRGKTDFSAWIDAGKIQNNFIDTIMDLKCHVIVTLRSKTEYVQEKDPETGKSSIKKLGLAPVQRDDFEYEFLLVMDLDKDSHYAQIIKDNTFLDAEGFYGKITPNLGKRLNDWMNNGVEPEIYTCECCGKKIKSANGKNGLLSPSQVAENSKKMFNKVMCMDCVMKEVNKQAEAEEEQ